MRPALSHVGDGVIDLEALGGVAGPHPQLAPALALGAGQVDGHRRGRHGDSADVALAVVGRGEIQARQHCGVRSQAGAPQVAQEELVAVGILVAQGRVVRAQADQAAGVVDPEQQGAAAGVEEGGHRLGGDGLHGVVALAGAQIHARGGLELQALGLPAAGGLGDRLELGLVLQPGGDGGGQDDDPDGGGDGADEQARRPQVVLVEEPGPQRQAAP